MIYGQDEPVATPTIDLYDTNMMQMYVNAAREQYKAAQEEQKEFLKTYGDFYSPFAKDNDFWYNHTMGPVQNLFNEAAARGIDLARSPEGRAMLARALRDIPYAKLATIRRNAAAGEEYLKNRAALQKAGKYNDDYEKYILGQAGLPAFEDWDSSTMGAWTRTSPEEYKDLHDSTYQWVDNNKKRYLRMTPDGRYQIWGVTDDDIRSSLTPHLSGFVGNNLGAYHLANAKREVLAENPNLSDAEADALAMKRLQDNIVQANREYTYEEREVDPYAKNAIDFAQQWKLATMKENAADRRAARAEAGADRRAMLPYLQQDFGDVPPLGAADQQAQEQALGYKNTKDDFVKSKKSEQSAAWNSQRSAYGKLNASDKRIATKYGKMFRLLSNKNATPEQKKEAQKYITLANNKKDANFVSWRNAFNHRMSVSESPESQWLQYSTTQGSAKYTPGTPQQLYKNSHDIFDRLNNIGELGDAAKLAINQGLGYSVDKKTGNRMGSSKRGSLGFGSGATRDIEAITVADMTGQRRYKYDSIVRRLSRLFKSKDHSYVITPENVTKRKYASGQIGGKRYNVINEIATFADGSDISKFLDGYSEAQLAQYGITRNAGGGWDVPISTKYGHGQLWANINSAFDKNLTGTSETAKRQATRQAVENTAQFKNQ